MVQPDAVEAAIQQVIPDANVTVEDLTGGGDHLQVTVVSSAFAGLSRIRQHQMVYGALQQELASEAIHALALNTSTPSDAASLKLNSGSTMDTSTKARIETLVSSSPIFVFMKGSKLMPQCGFSNNVVQILHSLGVAFETFDVLSDPEIRQGIKEFSSWPTIPQVYVKGEFIGGSDILIEMYNTGELREKLEIALAS